MPRDVVTIPQSERDPAKVVFAIRELRDRVSGDREVLTEDRTYYVRTDGSDNNNGLLDSASGAFLTIQKAVDTALKLDADNSFVVVQIADGTYAAGAVITGPLLSSGNNLATNQLYIQGNLTTPSNVNIAVPGGTCFYLQSGAFVDIAGVKMSGGTAINTSFFSIALPHNVEFGACTAYHMVAGGTGASIYAYAAYKITGNASAHVYATQGGGVTIGAGITVTITGTPAFGRAFAFGEAAGTIDAESITFTGSATGPRYDLNSNAIIWTTSTSESYLPGDTQGITNTGGIYFPITENQSFGAGTFASGTFTPNPNRGRQQHITNNGAFTLAAPVATSFQSGNAYNMQILITNSTSAGAITFSGFTVKGAPGDALTTTNGNKFLLELITINAIPTYRVYALQ